VSCEACCYFQGNKRGRGVHNRPRHRTIKKKKNCAVGFAFTTTICGGTPATGNRPVGVRFRGALSRGIIFRSGLVHMKYGGAEDRKLDFRGPFGGEFGGLIFKGFSVILRFGFGSIAAQNASSHTKAQAAPGVLSQLAASPGYLKTPRHQDPKTPENPPRC